ncbi:type III restriction protein res subunit [Gluconacetobacter diazotrophicus PA1 5]|uniref:DEAD/DEAH box helicase n=1 Tax=Gluconacetobacter diazotrophicus TaxID=33996 RepID=UPI000173DC1E|nr:DEAD/DEAH box helicase family protein [Gluconacetobacter diazotrophicus]ACI52220.1 type III restriction protein res subunit [Gluconacetobacter diazotrophicus PA1 5]TWB00450.1 superfamily II DNA or RNA helicase [Gluconacetobacter diazotrophicus]
MIQLRPYQQQAIDGVRSAFRDGHRAPLLVAPTGAGKTVMFSHIAQSASAKQSRVLIIAHRKELIRQASRKLSDTGVDHGIIAPWAEPTGHLVQVASVQTLARRLDALPRFDLIIMDEAHHAVAGTWAKVIAAQPWAKILGVTATPERMDGRGLGANAGGVFDMLVMGPTIGELIQGEFLTPSRVFAPVGAPDLTGVKTRAGDYDIASLSKVMAEPKLVGDAVEHYGRYASGLPAIAFCACVEDAKTYADAFCRAGWRATAAYGAMPGDERDAAIGGLATGAVQVLTTCDLVSEGLDVPCVGAVILLRPTKSLGLHVQQIGRGLRPMPGKSHLIVLDHAGNTFNHGLPDQPHDWSLDGRKKKDKGEPVATWRCEHCFAMNSAVMRVCAECGERRASEGKDEDDVERAAEVADGELIEMDPEMQERLQYLRSAPFKELMRKAKTDDDLREIAKARGYRAGWVWKMKQERMSRAGTPA